MSVKLIFISMLFLSFSANAQTQKAKEKFMKVVFNDFKKGRLDAVANRFVDSVFLDDLIAQNIFKDEEPFDESKLAELHQQRNQAKQKLLESLVKTYEEFTDSKIVDRLRNAKPEMIIYSERTEPIPNFGIQYTFILDDQEAEIKINRVVYDNKRKRFVIMAGRIRSSMIPGGPYVQIAKIREVIETEEIGIDDNIAMPEKEPDLKKVTIAPREEPKKDLKEEVFQVVEKMPEFPGGEAAMYRFITKNINYPPKALESGLEGRVFTQFVVGKDGALRNFKVIKGIGGGCDEEALRVIKSMPTWKPGTQSGKAVAVMFNLPFSFKLK